MISKKLDDQEAALTLPAHRRQIHLRYQHHRLILRQLAGVVQVVFLEGYPHRIVDPRLR